MTDPKERMEPEESLPPGDELVPEEELVPEDDRVIGVAFRWSLLALAIIAAAVVVAVVATREAPEAPVVIERGPVEAPRELVADDPSFPEARFVDATDDAGIDFVHVSGARGGKLLPETMGSGAAFVDVDADGDQDLVLVNGTSWPGDPWTGPPPTQALYLNDGSGRFEDATARAGLDATFYGTGIACADYDGDGDVDLFFAALGPNHLFRNDEGRFVEVTREAGLAGGQDSWSTSAGFFDHDNDGDLDLFVVDYVKWSAELDRELNFTLNGRDRAYGPPRLYQGTDDHLYRNDGDGHFTDISEEAGIHVRNPATGVPVGKGLALTFADFGGDGWMDVFVANDTVQNFLFRNRGDGTFEEVGALTGVAYDDVGTATGAMGVDVGDFGNDGALAIGIGNFANESTSFYVQQRDGWRFADVSGAEGIGSPSRLALSFGLFFFDFDLDGRLDLLQANGHLEDEINEVQPSQHYRQPAQLFWNRGRGHGTCFVALPGESIGDLARPIVGRAATHADVDGDGDVDILLTQAGDRPLLLRNDTATGHHWLRVRVEGEAPNRDAVGARVTLEAAGVRQTRRVVPTRSYLAQVELPVTFGLGDATQVDRLTVRWPDGHVRELTALAADRLVVVARQ